MTPKQFQRRYARKPARSEHHFQASLVKWCRGQGASLVRGRFMAIPNGGARDAITGSKLKAEGVKAGAPDMIFYGNGGRVLWLELKNGTAGKVSDKQAALHLDLADNGHSIFIVRTLAEACEKLTNFYKEGSRE